MNLIVVFLSIEKSAIGGANAWEKLKYANPVNVLTAVRIMLMIPDQYNDSKTYKHGELCRRWTQWSTVTWPIAYRASCTGLAMQGIPPEKDNIGHFWIAEGLEGEAAPTMSVLARPGSRLAKLWAILQDGP